MRIAELARQFAVAKWNAIVGKRWSFSYEDRTHFVFLHPTKGYRRVSKSRLVFA